jgi:predicted transcriptional regulator
VSKRRDRIDIVYSILRTVARHNPGARVTRILYEGNLSHPQLTNYLALLLKTRLVTAKTIGQKTLYDITNKGKEFVHTYERMRGVLES